MPPNLEGKHNCRQLKIVGRIVLLTRFKLLSAYDIILIVLKRGLGRSPPRACDSNVAIKP